MLIYPNAKPFISRYLQDMERQETTETEGPMTLRTIMTELVAIHTSIEIDKLKDQGKLYYKQHGVS